METYSPDAKTDFLLLDWYDKLVLEKEFFSIFMPNAAPLSAFFRGFQPPVVLVYEADEAGIWAAAWLEPTGMNAGFFGVWTRREKRATKDHLAFTLQAMTHFLTMTETLVATIRNVGLIHEMKRFGFVEAGTLPRLFYTDENASVLALTKDAFIAATQTMRAERLSS